MSVTLTAKAFDPWQVLSNHCNNHPDKIKLSAGANSIFIGNMRDFNENHHVQSMELEYYPQMTQLKLEQIINNHIDKYNLLDALIIHRVGEVIPGEAIVLAACWSMHRKQAFTANQSIVNELKCKAPFWKREKIESGYKWVTTNTPD